MVHGRHVNVLLESTGAARRGAGSSVTQWTSEPGMMRRCQGSQPRCGSASL